MQLPNGDKLGKIIIDYYLANTKSIDIEEEINLSKDFNILSTNRCFFAEIQNEIPMQEEMITLSNKNNKIINNIEEEKKENFKENDIISNNNFILSDFSSDNLNSLNSIPEELKPKKKCFCCFFSNFFNKKNEIIKKKYFKHKAPKSIKMNNNKSKSKKGQSINKKCCCRMETMDMDILENKCSIPNSRMIDENRCMNNIIENSLNDDCLNNSVNFNSNNYNICNDLTNDNKNIEICLEIGKTKINFDAIIQSQNIIEGNWENNNEVKNLIEEENIIYEKINKISDKYNITEEEGKITLLVLYYIYTKKQEKINELKFIINKAKAYIKKIYNLEYEEISKEIN